MCGVTDFFSPAWRAASAHAFQTDLSLRCNRVGWESALQDAAKEEPQCCNAIHNRPYCKLSFMQQMSLPLANVVRAELIRRFRKVSCELFDRAEVTACGL
jgi:hypothetical protein